MNTSPSQASPLPPSIEPPLVFKIPRTQSTRTRLILAILIFYLPIFPPLYALLGDTAIILSAVPVAVVGWFAGTWASILTSSLMLLADLVLMTLSPGQTDSNTFAMNAPLIWILFVVIGTLTGMMGEAKEYFSLTLTAHHQTEELLRGKEQQLQSVVTSNGDGMLVINLAGEIQLANPAACALFGRPLDELMAVQLGSPIVVGESVELDLPRSGGEAGVAEMRVVNIDWNGKPAYLASLRDITERKRTQEVLEHYASEMSALYDTISEINGQVDLKTLLQAIAQRAGKLVNVPISELYLISPDQKTLDLAAATNPQVKLSQFPIDQGLAGYVIRNGAPHIVNDYSQWEHHIDDLTHYGHQTIGRAMGVPLHIKGRALGAITVADYIVGTFDNRMMRLLELFAEQAAIAVENARLYGAVQQMAITDELTDVYNRHGFFQLAKHEIERAARLNEPIGLIILDVDHFKQVNDVYGHMIGDRVLREIAQTCQAHVRSVDVIGRYGGEEMVILLPQADLATVQMIAERLRLAIAEIRVPTETADAPNIQITASFGIASQGYLQSYNLDELIRRADTALYQAKQMGRNAVITAE